MRRLGKEKCLQEEVDQYFQPRFIYLATPRRCIDKYLEAGYAI